MYCKNVKNIGRGEHFAPKGLIPIAGKGNRNRILKVRIILPDKDEEDP